MKTQMPFNNEIEKTKKEIEVLTAKLALLEEIENFKTPCEDAYKDAYGKYPVKVVSEQLTSEDNWNVVSWSAFQKGYSAAEKDWKVGDYQPTTQEPKTNKIKTLYDICVEWNDDDDNPPVSALIFKIEKEWTPLNLNQKEKRGYTDVYSRGFDDALDLVRKTLR